jgi:hypothetical protein
MQYLVSVIDDTAGLATSDEMAAINAFNEKAEGHWVFAGGLAAPSTATVIDNLGDTLAGYHAYHATCADLLRRLAAVRSRARRRQSHRAGGQHRRDRLLTRRSDQLRKYPSKPRASGARPRWNPSRRGRRRGGRPNLPAPATTGRSIST